MPRRLKTGILLGFGAAALAAGAIFPENWGASKLVSGKSEVLAPLADKPLAEELGYETGEKGSYVGPMGKFEIEARRFKDPTSALVYYFATRPAGSARAPQPLLKDEPLALIYPKGLYWAHGNYVARIEGWTPAESDLKVLYESFAKLDQSSLPVLPAYLPLEGRQADSERYILGPVSLERYEARIGAAMAAFSMGAEAVAADYGSAGRLIIFNYPTHDIARQRSDELRKTPNSVVKRSGPLVAVALGAQDPNAAERVLAKVNYQAALTWNEPDPNVVVKNTGQMLLSIVELAGVIGALAIGTGVMFGLLRYMRRRLSPTNVDETMITLDLGKR